MAETDRQAPLARLWDYAAGYRKRIVLASIYSFLNKAVDLAPPFLIGHGDRRGRQRQGDSFLGSLRYRGPKGTNRRHRRDHLRDLERSSRCSSTCSGVEWRNLAQNDPARSAQSTPMQHIQELDVVILRGPQSSGDLMAVLNDDVNQLERFLDIGANEVIQLLTTVVLIGASVLHHRPLGGVAGIPPDPR